MLPTRWRWFRPATPRRRLAPRVEAAERRTLRAGAGGPLLIAALGDSLTDEYTFTPTPAAPGPSALPDVATVGVSSARNWVSMLAATRSTSVSFGAYTTAFRAGTRDQGFAEDWARVGATAAVGDTNSLPMQVTGAGSGGPGLVTQTVADSGHRPSDVGAVVLMIGTNDYLDSLGRDITSAGAVDDFATRPGRTTDPLNARVEGAIGAAVGQIRRAIPRARIVIVSPPDITETPEIAAGLRSATPLDPGLADAASASLRALNADLARTARSQHLGLVDAQTLFARREASPTVAGAAIDYAASGPDWTDGYIGDGFHPGTILQGFLAQAIVGQVDALAGHAVIPPLTDAEIVAYAQAVQPTATLAAGPAATAGSTTLTATAAAGPGSTTVPTGTVTFEAITPATGDQPARFGTVLGSATLGATGTATLTVPTATLDTANFYAVYAGDEGHTARISPGLVPAVGS